MQTLTRIESALNERTLPRINDDYLIDEDSITLLTNIVLGLAQDLRPELREQQRKEAESLLVEFLVAEGSDSKAIVGPFALRTTPTEVLGAILAVVGVLLLGSTGATFASPGGALVLASSAQALASMLSVLTRDEKRVISIMATVSARTNSAAVPYEALTREALACGIEAPTLLSNILSLSQKQAVLYEEGEHGTVQLKKWL